MDPIEMIKGIQEVYMDPSTLIERLETVVNRRWKFAPSHFPRELRSDEPPPYQLGERDDVFPIDELLGCYYPDRQEIKIYNKGIEDVAKRLELHKEDITIIVRYHEWAHALLHIGLNDVDRALLDQNESAWPEILAKASSDYGHLDSNLHERLAQLIVHYILRFQLSPATAAPIREVLERIAMTFEQLCKHTPGNYRIEKYLNVPREKIVDSIALLKENGLVGFKAWDTVITWCIT